MIFLYLGLSSLFLGSTLSDPEPEPDPGILYAAAPEDRGQFHIGGKGRYNYGYNTGDGIAKVEVGHPDGSITGSYRYFDPYGRQVVRTYIADHKGFRVLGNDLPVSANAPVVGHLGSQTLTGPVEGLSGVSSLDIDALPSRTDIVLRDGSNIDPCTYSDCSSTRTRPIDPCTYSDCSSTRTRPSCTSSRGSSCTSSSSRNPSSCSSSRGSSCTSSSSTCSGRCSSSSRRCCSSSRSCCSSTRRSCCRSSSNCSWQRNCCPSPCHTSGGSTTYSYLFLERQREADNEAALRLREAEERRLAEIRRQEERIRRQEAELSRLRDQKRKLVEDKPSTIVREGVLTSSGAGANYFFAKDKLNYDFPAGFTLNYKGTKLHPLYVRKSARDPFTIGKRTK